MTYSQNDGASTRDVPKDTNSNILNSSITYWTFSPGEKASKWQLCINEGIMCIGWDALGDLSHYSSREDMRKEIKKHYPTDGSAINDSLAVWQFSHEMKPGDIVFAKKGKYQIIGRGIVESDYMFDSARTEFKNIRKVKWTNIGEWTSDDRHAIKTLTNVTSFTNYVKKLNYLIDRKNTPKQVESTDKQYWWLTGSPKYWSPSNDWDLGKETKGVFSSILQRQSLAMQL